VSWKNFWIAALSWQPLPQYCSEEAGRQRGGTGDGPNVALTDDKRAAPRNASAYREHKIMQLLKHSLLIFLGSGAGGVARLLLNNFITGLTGMGFPWGILTINVLGSTCIGLVAGWFAFRGDASGDMRLFLATGILGGFTTFSAFSLDATVLYERGQPGLALLYIVASVVLSLLGLAAALWTVRWATT
jgi:CrcB protein